jgi:hypothetical protein
MQDTTHRRRNLQDLRALCHPRERSRFVLALVPSTALLLLIAIGVGTTAGIAVLALAAVVVAVLVGSVWVALQVSRARLLGGAIRVSADSFPQIQVVIDELREQLDYRERLEVWVVEKHTDSITLTSYLGTKMILIDGGLASDVLATDTHPQLRFLIARFIGALKAKHLRLAPLQVIIGAVESLRFLNLFITPYNRAIVYSGDQIGLACVGDLPAALAAINRLLVGKEMAPELAARGVFEQAEEVRRRVLPRAAQLFSRHPHLTSRYLNLLRFGESFDRNEYQRTVASLTGGSLEGLPAHKPTSAGWLAPVLVGIPSVALVALVGVALAAGGSSASSSAASQQAQTSASQSAAPAPQTDQVKQSVADLSRELDLAGEGRARAVAGDWEAAIANRRQVLAELEARQFDPRLDEHVNLLSAALDYSLAADYAHSACDPFAECPAADRYDSLATSVKQRFLAAFNELSMRYGGRQYQETDF